MFCQVIDIFQKFLYQKCMQTSSKEFQRLSSPNYTSLTTDILWSSTNCHHSFLSLTAHFIVDSSMEKKDVMLSIWWFTHTAANISVTILSHVRSWEIEEKIVCILWDNAANMIAGMNYANLKSHASLQPVHAWFLIIDPVQIVGMCVCVCVRARGY